MNLGKYRQKHGIPDKKRRVRACSATLTPRPCKKPTSIVHVAVIELRHHPLGRVWERLFYFVELPGGARHMSTEIRVATFNASMSRGTEGGLIADLSTGDNSQAQSIAEIIQKTDADIILINEFDFDAAGQAADLFLQNYLSVGQNGATPIDYGYVYAAPSNTGVLSGFDLNNDGTAATTDDLGSFTYANDSQGFGQFPGQFGFVIYSKHPIDTDNIRSFQEFLWKDMPDNLLTDGAGEVPLNEYYSAEEIDALRLSSKNHVDVPVFVGGEVVHVLAAHPTPPVFDGAEDRNGKRNHDEIRFWADYVDGAEYIYDDAGQTGGLDAGERFVIVGDYNADPFDGDSFDGAINQLLDHDAVQGSATEDAITPDGPGGREQAVAQGGDNAGHDGTAAFDTADFGFNGADPANDNPPGNLRVDYALPSESGLAYLDGGVYWPESTDPDFVLTSFPTSDHRLVYTDLRITDQDRRTQDALNAEDAGLGNVDIPDDVLIKGTRLGGLSGITYDPQSGKYYAVSDDRGAGADGTPRLYQLDIDLSDGSLDAGDVTITDVIALTLEDGTTTLDAISPDPEGIAIGRSGELYISSERDADGNPAIYTFGKDGVLTGGLAVDDKFLPDDAGTQGVRNNLGFESLTVSPDQTTLWTATESALAQDGPRATVDAGSAARIVKYDTATGEAVAEYIYEVDPIAVAPTPSGAFADSGLVELLAIDNQGTLLALERSFSVGGEDRGYTGKLYLVRTQGATNVIEQDSVPTGLDDGALEINVDEVAQKKLLLDLGDLGIVIDNVEGMTLGPVLEDGRQSLIIVSDDNFDAFGPQENQVIALALDLETVPTITPVLETPDELRYAGPDVPADSAGVDPDDPAIWLSPTDAAESLIITAMKEGGLRVYDLAGTELSRLEPVGVRYNNVDLIYGFETADGVKDIAVASDRANDTLAVFQINADGTLNEITSANIPATIFGVDDSEATAYGLAAYRSVKDGEAYVYVTQADGASIAQLKLVETADGVSFEPVRILDLPVPSGEDADDFQSEGIVIDRETGVGYVAVEEELGLLSFNAEADGDGAFDVVAGIDSSFFEADLEGVELYYGTDGEGLIVVSSQGDSTFAVLDRKDGDYLGSFAIRGDGDVDGVEESDGLAIFSGALPGFENGLLVTQDGSNEAQVVFGDPEDGEIQNFNVNFKYSDLGDVLAQFGAEPNISWDPRAMDEETTFTLELLHFTDQEAGVTAIEDAPNLSAVLNALRAQDLGDDGIADNTLTLSSGDAFIPGLFYDASTTAFGAGGIADIEIQNQLGVQAIALGNHEFDFGTADLAGLISGDAAGSILGADFAGTLFPYLSTNLDVTTDDNLAPLATDGGQAPQAGKIASSTVLEAGGEKIGVVGATTPTLDIISSPGDVSINPGDFDPIPTPAQLDALAAEIQAEVDALLTANPDMNKIVLLAHMQQIDIEVGLAERLENVDIIVAGGSNTRLFDENDVVRAGDSVQGEYPIVVDNAGGTKTAVVNTDGSYKYVGRLVIDFDEDGNIIPESYDANISGAYATDDVGVAALDAEGLVDPEIQQIVDEIQAVIIDTESNVFGVSDVFLNGNRSGADTATDTDGVRTQETNLGNLTADANLAMAQEADDTVLVSIKNGGGIRASIGQTVVPAGGTEPTRTVNEQVVDGDGNVVKPEGGISQNDIATTLAFNNGLSLLTLTKQELVDVLEHGVSAVPGVAGRFPQVSGVKFSYDPDLPAGARIQNAGIYDGDTLVMELVRDGALIGDADTPIRIVTLSFLAGGGDGYPFPTGEAANRVDLFEGETEDTRSGDATFADDGTEQDALAEYLDDNFRDIAFDAADTGRDEDTRIQNLNFREDAVFEDGGATGAEFVFGAETNNGVQERFSISSFNIAEDTLVLEGGNGVAEVVQRATGVAVYLQGEKDAIYVLGDDIVAEDLKIEMRDPSPAPAGNEVVGTEDTDSLIGTAGDDMIRSLGGDYDRMRGGAGADEFIFGSEVSDGVQSRDLIADYEAGIDTIVFEEAVEFRDIVQRETGVAIYLQGDNDAIYVLGDDLLIEDLTILNGVDAIA